MRILCRCPAACSGCIRPGGPSKRTCAARLGARGGPGAAGLRPLRAPPRAHPPASAADLFLDTLLYNAAATASLSLQAGVPVLTCLGDTFASRVGASLLTAVGLPELVARDLAHYERIAIELARNPEELRQIARTARGGADDGAAVRHAAFRPRPGTGLSGAVGPPRLGPLAAGDRRDRRRRFSEQVALKQGM